MAIMLKDFSNSYVGNDFIQTTSECFEELKNQIDDCIDHLPEKYAMVFRMKTIQEFETEEICKELDITPSNLWVIIHRARTQLRSCMEKNWFNK